MKKETLVLESSIVVPVKKRDTTLTVKLGWDAKSGTPKEKIKGWFWEFPTTAMI